MSGLSVLTPFLRLASLGYRGAMRARNRHYDRPGNSKRASIPILSVGNLTVGGTGKTPIVGWLARRLLDAGHLPAVVSRGYGGTAGRGPLVVSRGEGPSCGAERCGDEPHLLADSLPGVAIVVGSDRHAGAEAAANLGRDVVILDDGFQHRGLLRDLDIVLLDASNPFGNYHVLPAGRLRESIDGLRRADIIVITRSRPDERHTVIEHVVRLHNDTAPIIRAGHRRVGFFDAGGQPAERPSKAVAFCGIGNPSRFRIDLEEEGVEIVEFNARADHHRHTEDEIRTLADRAARASAVLVTTEKDLVRVPLRPTRPAIVTLRIEAELFDSGSVMRAVDRVLGAFRR